jgi:hypothetical protein
VSRDGPSMVIHWGLSFISKTKRTDKRQTPTAEAGERCDV